MFLGLALAALAALTGQGTRMRLPLSPHRLPLSPAALAAITGHGLKSSRLEDCMATFTCLEECDKKQVSYRYFCKDTRCEYKALNCPSNENKDAFKGGRAIDHSSNAYLVGDPFGRNELNILNAIDQKCRGKPDRVKLCITETWQHPDTPTLKKLLTGDPFLHVGDQMWSLKSRAPVPQPQTASLQNVTFHYPGAAVQCELEHESKSTETRTKIEFVDDTCKLRVMRCVNCGRYYVAYDEKQYLVLRSGGNRVADEAWVWICEENSKSDDKVFSLRSVEPGAYIGAGKSGWVGGYKPGQKGVDFRPGKMRLFLNNSNAIVNGKDVTTISWLGWRGGLNWHGRAPVCVHKSRYLLSYSTCRSHEAEFRFLDPDRLGWFEDGCEDWNKYGYRYLKEPHNRLKSNY